MRRTKRALVRYISKDTQIGAADRELIYGTGIGVSPGPFYTHPGGLEGLDDPVSSTHLRQS